MFLYSLLIFIVAHLIYQIQCNKMALNSWSNSLTYLFYLEYIADKEESPRESPKVLDTTSGGENLCKQRTLKRDLSLGPPIKVSTEKYDLLPRKLVSCLREKLHVLLKICLKCMPHFFSRSCLTIFIYQLDLLFKNVVRLLQTLKKKTENVVLFPFAPFHRLTYIQQG